MMMIPWFPFFIVFFVLLMAGAFSRRGHCGPAVLRPAAPVALTIASILLLLISGLLLAGGLYFVHSSPQVAVFERQIPPPPMEEPWPIPVAAPRAADEAPSTVSDSLIAEASEAEQGASRVTQKAKAAVQTEPTSPLGRPRPAWMDAEMGWVAEAGLYRTRVTVGPWLTRTECEQELPVALQNAITTYADHFLGEGKGQFVHLPMSYVRDHVVRGGWEEHRQQTIDTMIYLHELLEFDRDANKAIEANYKQSVVAERLGYTAAGGGVLLGLLTIVFGYLKLDTLTRGYYTGRLRFAVATAIIGAVAATVVLLFIA